ncbi:MarR family transcriptional regulator [Halomonas sp. ATBC28]|jgi:DNA-binding MarR family transcriptional regulator|uniref:MarR family winged helix-turn-helix transcriptional regulator n=1 Tax=Halomonadaceae TaxID=28256 RepID=UPI00059B1C63|nr:MULTISPECIES: MarR family transcriptional regulator [unclassified Halomonas]KIN16373.1 MarR family transcriptional regulator [Halomonas sp. KHS3]TMU23254.1 MarR family transcriptional regulator [Halomonas sp. ATBC28]UEQ05671.1 MarR family transcriptional regulator [Halomonas profundus]
MTAESLSKERLRLWLRMLRVTRQVESELRERLRTEHDSTLPRFDVMAALYAAEEGLKMNELSKRLRVSNGNVTGIIDRLVEDGAVERIAIEGDRRATRVCLTSAGRESFRAMAVEHERWINALFEGVTEEDAHHIGELLHRLPTAPHDASLS